MIYKQISVWSNDLSLAEDRKKPNRYKDYTYRVTFIKLKGEEKYKEVNNISPVEYNKNILKQVNKLNLNIEDRGKYYIKNGKVLKNEK